MPPRKEAVEEPSFEAAMERLEAILTDMESGKLALEELLERYEEGVRLARICSSKLESAEKRIQIIGRDSDGKIALTPFEDKPADASHSSDESNEVSLF